MEDLELLAALQAKDDKEAYAALKAASAESAESDIYCHLLDEFAKLLENKQSYIRTRGFIMCCSQVRWDTEGKLEEILPSMLRLFHDEKPTVVRQCLKAVAEVILYRPELGETIEKEIGKMDLSKYKDSMAPLIRKDMDGILEMLK